MAACEGTSAAKRRRGATSPLVAAARAEDGRDGAHRGHSLQLSEGWVARRNAHRPTGTDDGELRWKAAQRGGQGPAAHPGADCRLRTCSVDPRCSYAADGRPAGFCPQDHRHLTSCNRSAQDLSPGYCSAALAGRKCGNSWWKCQRFFTSSSRPLTLKFSVVAVFKVFSHDRVQQRYLLKIILTISTISIFCNG